MMSKQRFPSDPVEEPQEELEARRSMSETLYERDMAYFKVLEDQRCREGRGGFGGF
jgi:hypothetical protein